MKRAGAMALGIGVALVIACQPKSTPNPNATADGGTNELTCTTFGNSALSAIFQYDGLGQSQECAPLVSNIVFQYFQPDAGCQSVNAGVNTLINSGGFSNPSPGLTIFTADPLPFSKTGPVSLFVRATGYDAGDPNNFLAYGDGHDACDFTVATAGSVSGQVVDFSLANDCVLAAQSPNQYPAMLTLSQLRAVGPIANFTTEPDGGVVDGICP